MKNNPKGKNHKIIVTVRNMVIFTSIIILLFTIQKIKKDSKIESTSKISFKELTDLAVSNSPNFLMRFREIYPLFCKNIILLEPKIQNRELTFCAYIFLNFSSKDIARYTFVSTRSVQMRKSRLRKKFSIGSDKDIFLWMQNFNKITTI